jgi:ribosomal protein S18 acetylase RimI-like enzyme
MTKLIKENLYEFLLQFNQTAIPEKQDGIFFSGVPRLNIVLHPTLSKTNIRSQINDIIDFYKTRESNFSWIAGPEASLPDISEDLQNAGLLLTGRMQGMVLELQNYNSSTVEQTHQIHNVDSKSELTSFAELVARVYSIDKADFDHFSTLLSGAVLERSTMDIYYLSQNGSMICGAAFLKGKESGGIYWVATLPENRNQGLATIVVNHIIYRAKVQNYTYLVLQSSQRAVSLYKKLGFKECGVFTTYAYSSF